jgi:CubicO group peptidase (beta-lactamase class C family)
MPGRARLGGFGILVGACLLTVAAVFIWNHQSGRGIFGGGEAYSKVGQSVVDKVRDLAALTTVEVVESTTIEKGNDFGWLNWARGDRVFMFVVAKIGAGIDFEQLSTRSFEVDGRSGTVFVQMPPAQITYVAIDNSQTQVIDRDTGLFTKGDPKLESDARQVAEQVLRNAAVEAGILDRAQKNARAVIEALLLELGYNEVRFGSSRSS